jgi:hypothetical protein
VDSRGDRVTRRRGVGRGLVDRVHYVIPAQDLHGSRECWVMRCGAATVSGVDADPGAGWQVEVERWHARVEEPTARNVVLEAENWGVAGRGWRPGGAGCAWQPVRVSRGNEFRRQLCDRGIVMGAALLE